MNLDNLELIHIGKCGGSSITNELRGRKIKFTCVHIRKVAYNPNKKYVIVIRNPIKRFISAFYWRYHLVCKTKKQENRFKNEKDFLNKYQNVDNLCNDLKINPDIFNSNYVHHIKEDIHFYLKDFIDKCPKNQILGVICTETLKEDMKYIFDINVVKHEKKNGNNETINVESYKILKNYLKNDYMIIDKMFEYGWIDDKKYKILKE